MLLLNPRSVLIMKYAPRCLIKRKRYIFVLSSYSKSTALSLDCTLPFCDASVLLSVFFFFNPTFSLQEKRTERTSRTNTAVTAVTGNVTKTLPSSSPTVINTAYSISITGTVGRTTHTSSPVLCSTPTPAVHQETVRTQRSLIRNQRSPGTRLCNCTTAVRATFLFPLHSHKFQLPNIQQAPVDQRFTDQYELFPGLEAIVVSPHHQMIYDQNNDGVFTNVSDTMLFSISSLIPILIRLYILLCHNIMTRVHIIYVNLTSKLLSF